MDTRLLNFSGPSILLGVSWSHLKESIGSKCPGVSTGISLGSHSRKSQHTLGFIPKILRECSMEVQKIASTSTMLVCPSLEYAVSVWDLHTAVESQRIEHACPEDEAEDEEEE